MLADVASYRSQIHGGAEAEAAFWVVVKDTSRYRSVKKAQKIPATSRELCIRSFLTQGVGFLIGTECMDDLAHDGALQ